MNTQTIPSQQGARSARAGALWVALGAALTFALLKAPFLVAEQAVGSKFRDRPGLVSSLRKSFKMYWASGETAFPHELATVVRFWLIYHTTKAVVAGLLLVVLTVLTVALFKSLINARDTAFLRRLVLATSGVVAAAMALLSLLVTMANIQGAIAPFASLLPMLDEPGGQPADADTVAEVKRGLTELVASGGQESAPLRVMVSDFGSYHVAMAVVAAFVAVALAAATIALWRSAMRSSPVEARRRRLMVILGAAIVPVALGMVIITLANAGTATDPAPALLAFFEGGW